MKKGLILGLMLLAMAFVFAVGLVSAADTTITVQTYAKHSAVINVVDPVSYDALRTYEENADDSGKISVVFSSGNREINISVIIRNGDGKIVRNQKFGVYTTGSAISLDLRPDPNAPKPVVVPVVEPEPAPVVNVTNSTTNSTNVTTASVVADEQKSSFSFPKFNMKYIYYTIGVIVIIAIIILLIKFLPKLLVKFRFPSAPSGPVIGKSTAEKYYFNTKTTDSALAEAERKIREAQSEIDRIRSKKQRFTDAEKKFQEAKKELDKVKREDEL